MCLYSVATHLGGGERSLLDLAVRMSRDPASGYRPWVLLPDRKGPLGGLLEDAGVETRVVPMPGRLQRISRGEPWLAARHAVLSAPEVIRYLWKLHFLWWRRGTALIHSNGLKCHFVAVAAGRSAGIPVLMHLRDIYPPGPVRNALAAAAALPGVRMVANSTATAAAFPSADPEVVHNGIDPDVFAPGRSERFREALGLEPGVPVVGILGILARWKGQLEFLRMARKLLDRGVKAGFVVAGAEIYDTDTDRGYGESLRRECERLGLDGKVHFSGFEERPELALRAMDVAVHASVRPEPFGRTVIEAMGCGLPVVAARDGGVPDIVVDGGTGILYPPGDVDAMTDGVAALVSDPGLRERYGKAGRERVEAEFTLERHLRAMLGVYGRSLSRW